jgi:hypothetical protein
MQRPKKEGRTLVAGALVLLPILYFISIGPFAWAGFYVSGWLETRNRRVEYIFDPPTQQWRCINWAPDYRSQHETVIGCLYAPVFLLADSCEPLAEFVVWYVYLFGDS